MKKLLLLFLSASIVYCTQSQIVIHVDVKPINPTSTDNIVIATQVPLANGIYKFDSTLSIIGSSIYIHACYLYGWGTSGDVFIDTSYYTLGNLPNGQYYLRVVIDATLLNNDTICENFDRSDSVSSTFTVGATGIEEDKTDLGWKVTYDNTSSVLFIKNQTRFTKAQFTISDIQERLIFSEFFSSNNYSYNTSLLPAGLYFAIIETEKGRVVKRWVKE